MEFSFGFEKDIEVLKTIDETSEELSGFKTIEQEYPDQIVNDRFHIVRKIREKQDSLGRFYKWYEIDHHNRTIDRTPLIANNFKKNLSDIDYLSMMTGIDLPKGKEN